MINIKEYVENVGGLYIDISSMYTKVDVTNTPIAGDHYKISTLKRLNELWTGNEAIQNAVASNIDKLTNPYAVKPMRDAVSFDKYGWSAHLNKDFPEAANQTDKYGWSADKLIAAYIMGKFYNSQTDVMCIAMKDWQYRDDYSLDDVTEWLFRNKIRWDMIHNGTHYTVIITTPKAAAAFIASIPTIVEAVSSEGNFPKDVVNISEIPGMIINRMFSCNTIGRFGLDMFKEMGAKVPDIDIDTLPLSYRADPIPTGVDGVRDKLVVPTKTKFTPIAFAMDVFSEFGYIMDLSQIPVNARFPKLKKIIGRITGWVGTGKDYRDAVEMIIAHAMKYGNTVTVKQETSGITLSATNPKEPDADED